MRTLFINADKTTFFADDFGGRDEIYFPPVNEKVSADPYGVCYLPERAKPDRVFVRTTRDFGHGVTDVVYIERA